MACWKPSSLIKNLPTVMTDHINDHLCCEKLNSHSSSWQKQFTSYSLFAGNDSMLPLLQLSRRYFKVSLETFAYTLLKDFPISKAYTQSCLLVNGSPGKFTNTQHEPDSWFCLNSKLGEAGIIAGNTFLYFQTSLLFWQKYF